jgi:hypothetical protein
MVHVIFDTNSPHYDDFVQAGSGETPIPEAPNGDVYTYYRGFRPYQRGYGIQGGAGVGDVFRGLWRFFLPIMRRVGTTVAQEALNTGQRVMDKVVTEGQPLKSSIISEGKKGIDNVLEKGGLPKQFGGGRRIKGRGKSQKASLIPTHQTIIGSAIKAPIAKSRKRLRSDVFGLY